MQAAVTSDPELSRIEAALVRGKQSAEGRLRLAIFSASMQQVSKSGASPSLASVSAAIITGLEGPSLNDGATVSAMFFLLATLLPSISDPVLRVHAQAVSRRVTQALSKHADVVPVLRWACPVLSRLLLCQVSNPALPRSHVLSPLLLTTPFAAQFNLAKRGNDPGRELSPDSFPARATQSAPRSHGLYIEPPSRRLRCRTKGRFQASVRSCDNRSQR
jgi:hypothetical protein